MIRWLLPLHVVQGVLLAVSMLLNVYAVLRGPEHLFFQFVPYKADPQPLVPLDRPFTYERVAYWANGVFSRLFDFGHDNIEDHFRQMNIFFTEAGFIQFREDLLSTNWLEEMRIRQAVVDGKVVEPLRVTQTTPTRWELKGKIVIELDAPGYKVAEDYKNVTVRLIRGEPAGPVIAPDDPFPPTNNSGLRIEYVAAN